MTYFRIFETETQAWNRMLMVNKAACNGDVVVILEHPEGWALMDLPSAVKTSLPYSWGI